MEPTLLAVYSNLTLPPSWQGRYGPLVRVADVQNLAHEHAVPGGPPLPPDALLVATAWRTLEPHEPEYQQAYQAAARAQRAYGWEMPYADAEGEAEE